MTLTLQEVLVRALKKLEDSSFQRFIGKLNVWKVKDKYIKIPKNEVMGKDPEQLADLINKYYKYAYGAEVTLAVLSKINEKSVRESLQLDLKEVDITGQGLGTGTFTDRVNFIERHQADLITKIQDVDPVVRDLHDQDLLTEHQFLEVIMMKTFKEKNAKLFDIVSHWEDTGKFMVYRLLRKHNEELIKYLEMKDWIRKNAYLPFIRIRINFINRHRSDLVRWTSDIDSVLRDLFDQNLLDGDQYQNVKAKTTSEEKMEEFCDIISHWDDAGKYVAYTLLVKYNEKIKYFEVKDWIDYSDHLPYFTGILHFIDHHRSDLIRWIRHVDPVLHDLHDEYLLTEEQYNGLKEKTTSKDKMKELCDIISHWEDAEKYKAYMILREHNEAIIQYLEMKDRTSSEDHTLYFKGILHFIDHHRSDLIRWIRHVDPVLHDLYDQYLLTEEEYNGLKEKTTSKDKMKELCDIISHWEDAEKYKAYMILREHNEDIIQYLEMKDRTRSEDHTLYFTDKTNFIDHHRSVLIRRITDINPILRNFRNQELLTLEQYNDVMEKTTPREKMRQLCDIISHWEDTGKFLAYIVLKKYNEEIIKDLEKVDWRRSALDHSVLFIDKTNFIDRHQSTLIRRIKYEFLILRDLWYLHLLTEEQYNTVIQKPTSKERIRELCDIISDWEDTEKFMAYAVIKKYNGEVIVTLEKKDCEMKRRYRPKPIFKIPSWRLQSSIQDSAKYASEYHKSSENVGTIVAQGASFESLPDFRNMMPQNQGDMMPQCEGASFESLLDWRGAPRQINKLSTGEIGDLSLQLRGLIPPGRSQLQYQSASFEASPYWRNMMPQNQGASLKSLLDWRGAPRQRIKLPTGEIGDPSLQRHGLTPPRGEMLPQFQGGTPRQRIKLPTGEIGDPSLQRHGLTPPTEYLSDLPKSSEDDFQLAIKRYQPLRTLNSKSFSEDAELSHAMEKPQLCPVEMTVDNISCKLCGKEKDQEEELAEVVSTDGGVYRLELNSPGLYHCRKTGIKFLVKGPVIIEYKPESWVDHLKQIPDSTYEILGSLFNIKTSGDPNAVSAVHLPHFLCLKGNHEDRALIKCAHFQDGNLTLVNPTQIDPFYIVLENPIFSCLGPLLSIGKKKIPIHGIVLIYFKIMCKGDPAEEYRIHLYVLPHTINAEENLDKGNKKFGFQRIKKPEQTIDTVYTRVKYLVTGRPGVLICPETVKFQAERYNFTEIQLKEKDVNICLYVSEKNTGDEVWQVHLTKSDINDIIQSLSQLTICEVAGACSIHFMEKHMAALIQRTTSIRPVTDNLLSQKVLTQEQYDTVRSRTPHQQAMRQLYEYMRSWGNIEKDKFYEAVKKHNRHLITDLEASDDTD
ncbi:uncharacterized protein [Ranitomeya imitator]|uniref:uncharacterized protein n=1 Tax=Ranitomeya imitator TaxID=111125 RepID=UPI0037E78892